MGSQTSPTREEKRMKIEKKIEQTLDILIEHCKGCPIKESCCQYGHNFVCYFKLKIIAGLVVLINNEAHAIKENENNQIN